MKITGYLPAETTAADLFEAADTIESGYVPDEEFLALVADLLRTEARATTVMGAAFRGFAPAPVSIHLVQHLKERIHAHAE